MAKFVYRMQSILNIKEKLEEQARMEFAQANANLAAEEEKLEKLKERRFFYEEQGRKLRESSLNVMDLMENRDAIERMKEFIETQKIAVRKAEDEVEFARVKLTEAMQETKTQHKLKEKAFEEFIREENAREAKEIDELTSYVYGQKR
ncbi:MAG: flagellar export protein FliJ [Lachnospiraceae bacterium]|nr:flagellar export protein FliJ [Lachnospiraceae bacterium]